MPIQKTEAIILKSQKLGETSKIITLYSRNYGKIKVVAKGARGLKSRFFGTLESLNFISLVFYVKENRNLQFLSQAEIIKPFIHIKNNLEKLSLASVASEFILKSQYADESNPYLFKTILEFLNGLETASTGFENYFCWFQLKFLKSSGFKPQLDECVVCKKKNFGSNKFYFSIDRGGCICSNCKKTATTRVSISQDTLTYLQFLDRCLPEEISEAKSSTQVINESTFVLNKFTAYHIEGIEHLKSIKFLERIRL